MSPFCLFQTVFCTCTEAGSARVTKNIKPTHVIIDEAAMATEPEAMVPIHLADHVTLIGDHMQLQVRSDRVHGIEVSELISWLYQTSVNDTTCNVLFDIHFLFFCSQ